MKNNREHVLKVATKLISQRGFDGASTREIAQTAKVSQGMINYYFGSKEALLKEIINDYQEQINNTIKSIVHSNLEGLEFLSLASRKFFDIGMRNRDLARVLMVEEMMEMRQEVISQSDEVGSSITNIFVDKIEEGKKNGTFNKNADSELIVSFLINTLNDYIIREERVYFNTLKDPYSEAAQQRLLDFSDHYLKTMLSN
ncbi:TetR/AcrR family transcriptional regulator [Flammeovirga sp. MY04]|uniref:TetR/AcrR family transcriptional regulator n=1 Tax=Flammeovirga sp. MY04 TaxID=1191459 RepID=UPI00080612FE|nr:TetR/AcrR family transcriptional regulator [Flammeovirga sp. MY04]ANQ51244.1 TetR/AcrR family transcriptional regulator [Flammeovirga sp. MY04]